MNTAKNASKVRTLHALCQLGLVAATFVLGGCGASSVQVQVPATELSKLSIPSTAQSPDWPTVRTVDGKEQQLVGTVESVHVSTPEGWVPINRSFYTRVNGPFFEIMDPAGVRGFPLATIPPASVVYADATASRKATGIALIGVGTPLAALGVLGIVAGSNIASSGRGLDSLVTAPIGVFVAFLGVLGAGGGLAMAIPGIVMVTTNPSKPRADQAKLLPSLQVGPRGASFRVAF